MSGFKGTKLAADKVILIGSRLEFYPEEAPEGVSSRVEEIKNGKILAAMPMNEKGVPIIPRPGEAMMGKTPGDGCFTGLVPITWIRLGKGITLFGLLLCLLRYKRFRIGNLFVYQQTIQ